MPPPPPPASPPQTALQRGEYDNRGQLLSFIGRNGSLGKPFSRRSKRRWRGGGGLSGTSERRVAQFAGGSAGPGSPDPLFTALRRGGSLSLREGVPVLGRRPHYFRQLREAGRSVCERQALRHQTGGSVCERECRSWVAGPIIYGNCARRGAQFARGRPCATRRVAQFARGSAGPGSPDPLFTALPQGGCLSSRGAVPVLGRRSHYLRHFRGGPGRGRPGSPADRENASLWQNEASLSR